MIDKKHLHTYKRMKTVNKKDLYICTHPDCTHNSRRELLLGRRARCYICGDPFIVSTRTLQFVNFRCEDCRLNKPKVRAILTPMKLEKLIEEIEI